MLQRYVGLFMVLWMPLVAMAVETSTLAPQNVSLKIGVIDVRTTIQKSPQLTTINTELAKTFKPREIKIVDAQAVLKAHEDKIQKDGATMADTDRNALRDKIITERANLQAMITSFQQDLDSAQNNAMQKLLSQIAMIVNDIAKQEKFDLILQGDNVPYVVDRLNITTQVLQQLSLSKK